MITPPEVTKLMQETGYFNPVIAPDGKLYALGRLIFTCAIICDITKYSYTHRYCYESAADAGRAFDEWRENEFRGEPSDYIVRKP